MCACRTTRISYEVNRQEKISRFGECLVVRLLLRSVALQDSQGRFDSRYGQSASGAKILMSSPKSRLSSKGVCVDIQVSVAEQPREEPISARPPSAHAPDNLSRVFVRRKPALFLSMEGQSTKKEEQCKKW